MAMMPQNYANAMFCFIYVLYSWYVDVLFGNSMVQQCYNAQATSLCSNMEV